MTCPERVFVVEYPNNLIRAPFYLAIVIPVLAYTFPVVLTLSAVCLGHIPNLIKACIRYLPIYSV